MVTTTTTTGLSKNDIVNNWNRHLKDNERANERTKRTETVSIPGSRSAGGGRGRLRASAPAPAGILAIVVRLCTFPEVKTVATQTRAWEISHRMPYRYLRSLFCTRFDAARSLEWSSKDRCIAYVRSLDVSVELMGTKKKDELERCCEL